MTISLMMWMDAIAQAATWKVVWCGEQIALIQPDNLNGWEFFGGGVNERARCIYRRVGD